MGWRTSWVHSLGRTLRGRCAQKPKLPQERAGVRRVSPGSAPSSPPCFLPEEEQTSPAPTFRHEEAAPPAVSAVSTAAAAPYAQRQQERHQAQPPRQHPRRLSRHRAAAAASYRSRRPRLPVSAGVRWCPPVPAAPPPWSCRVRFWSRRRRPHSPPPLPFAASLALPQQQHSLTRTRSGSSAHPGTARDVTEGGRWLVHIHETRTSARGCALPRLAAPAPNFPQPSPMPLARVIRLGQAPVPAGGTHAGGSRGALGPGVPPCGSPNCSPEALRAPQPSDRPRTFCKDAGDPTVMRPLNRHPCGGARMLSLWTLPLDMV